MSRSDKSAHRTSGRKGPKIDPCNHAQASERTNHQLVQVIARDVFHHASAALDELTVAGHKLHSQHVISGCPIELSQRRIHSRSNGPPHAGTIFEGYGQGQELPALAENARKAAKRQSWLDA